MAPISNHSDYCASMAHGLEHKLFFLQHLPEMTALLDWGCADGCLLAEVLRQRPEMMLLGHDTDEQMVEQAEERFAGVEVMRQPIIWTDAPNALEALRFTAEWANTTRQVPFSNPPRHYGGTGILFSSVLHEMYSHTPQQMAQHWQDVAATGVDYIIVRDMYWGQQGFYNLIDYPNFYQQFIKWLSKASIEESRQYYSFIHSSKCGTSARAIAEFLLKMPYTCNWQRELAESYFSVPDLRPILAELGYEPIHWHHHCPDFIHERIKQDTGIDLPFHTHLTAIFKRK